MDLRVPFFAPQIQLLLILLYLLSPLVFTLQFCLKKHSWGNGKQRTQECMVNVSTIMPAEQPATQGKTATLGLSLVMTCYQPL